MLWGGLTERNAPGLEWLSAGKDRAGSAALLQGRHYPQVICLNKKEEKELKGVFYVYHNPRMRADRSGRTSALFLATLVRWRSNTAVVEADL